MTTEHHTATSPPWPAHFSAGERDRRWQKVRELMARDGIDILVAPPNTGMWDQLQANVRYLTGVGGCSSSAAAVFPVEGEVTAVMGPAGARSPLASQGWVSDIRSSSFDHTASIIERLRELDASRARIGIPGLLTGTRTPDGLITHRGFQRLGEEFPEASFVDATHLMDHARFVKSDEELAFIRRAVGLADEAVEALVDAARNGATQAEAFAAAFASMAAQGGDLPTMLHWAVGRPHPGTPAPQAPPFPFRAGDVLRAEIEARWGGYIGQVTLTGIVGPEPPRYRDAFALQQEAVARCYERCRPGVMLGDILEVCEATARGTDYSAQLIMHGRGLGDDAPLVVHTARDPRMAEWRVEQNSVFIVKPVVTHADGTRVQWGDTIVATVDGAERLGRLPAQLQSLGE